MTTWKDIPDYEGLYQASEDGEIRVLPRLRNSRHGQILYGGKLLKPAKSKKGYHSVNLCKDGKQRSQYVHIIIATIFVPGRLPGLEVNHKDADKSNNKSCNLEWVTHKYNQEHAGKMGRMVSGKDHRRYNPALHNTKTI